MTKFEKDMTIEIEKIDYNSQCLQTAFLKANQLSFSSLFGNSGNKVLGQALYDVFKDLIKISDKSWSLDRDDWIDWIDEIIDEVNQDKIENIV